MKKLLYLMALFVINESTNVIRPRGVSLAKRTLYDPSKHFICLDGSARIPFEQVNDDYCDCNDGSDEPGTAACINGSFYCNNIGHEPKTIHSSWINDGVCDCCDTSDEYGSTASCINNCDEMGEAARIEAEIKKQEQIKGYDIRQQMAEEGLQLKKDRQVRFAQLEKDKLLAEALRNEKLSIKETMEIPEREALEKYKEVERELKKQKEIEDKIKDENEAKEAFNNLDSNGDGVIDIEEMKSQLVFDTNKDSDVSEDEVKLYLNQKESLNMESFLESSWALIKARYLYDRSIFTAPTTEPPMEELVDIDENIEEQRENAMDNDEYEDGNNQDEDTEEYEDEVVNSPAIETSTEEYASQYDEETQKLVDDANGARNEYNLEDKKVRDIINEMKTIEGELQKDYGPNEEFRPLAGSCFEFIDREYIYKICPFDYASQKQRSTNSETRLGTWGEWTGSESFPYSKMKYIGGQGCWNGPQRSVEVQLSCSTEIAILAVSEPNRCEYLFLFSTPSICSQPSQEDLISQHIEL